MISPRAVLLASLLSTSACVAGAGLTAGGRGTGTAGPTTTAGSEGGGESSYGGPAGVVAGTGGTAPAAGPAEPRWDDFAFAVRERSGTYYAPWILTKLTTFKVSPSCYAKLGDKESDSLNNTSYYARSVANLAKAWTGDDWDSIEGQNSDHAKNRTLVEPMIDAFASRFHMTIVLEGDDCDTTRQALWIRYWYAVGMAFEKYPPLAGKVFVTLNVSSKARDVTSDVDESGTQFTITAPAGIEARDWTDKLEKPFRRNAAKL